MNNKEKIKYFDYTIFKCSFCGKEIKRVANTEIYGHSRDCFTTVHLDENECQDCINIKINNNEIFNWIRNIMKYNTITKR